MKKNDYNIERVNGEFRTHIDYYDESGDITDRHAEIWCFPNWESMAEG